MKKLFTIGLLLFILAVWINTSNAQIDYYTFGTGGAGHTMNGVGGKDLPNTSNMYYLIVCGTIQPEPYFQVWIKSWSATNEILGDNDTIAKILNDNVEINGTLTTWTTKNTDSVIMLHQGSTSGTFGNFLEANRKFVAIRMYQGGVWRYGWIRVSLSNDGAKTNVTIYDMAINTVPDQPIMTGQTVGIDQRLLQKVNINYFNNTLYLNSNDIKPQDIRLSVCNLLGKELYHSACNNVMDLGFLGKGFYLLVLNSPQGTVTRKITIE
jgi:hypothetical protein